MATPNRQNIIERIRSVFLNTTTLTQYTNNSVKWFRDYITSNFVLRLNNARNYLNNPQSRVMPGSMYMFSYDPKWKEKLEYYDTFPCILCLETYDDGFLGLNLHYVDPRTRAAILVELLGTINNKQYDDTTKFKINYQKVASLSRTSQFKNHMIKRYLYTQLRTPVSRVEPSDWEIVIFLPLQNFKKAYSSKVWRDAFKR